MSFPAKMAHGHRKSPKKAANYSSVAFEIQRGLASLREDEVCTDFEVIVGDQTFLCHRAVLASVSDYFRAMFTSGMKETHQNKTTIDNISPEAFKVILDLLYYQDSDPEPLHGRADDELCELLRVTDMFQMTFLSKLCLEYFGNTMTTANCVQRWKASKDSHSEELEAMSWKYLTKSFENVAQEGFFSSLDFADLFTIIKDKHLQVSNEINVWQAISDWIDFDAPNRTEKVTELMKQVCLTEIAHQELAEEIAFDEKVHTSSIVSKMVQNAVKFEKHPGSHANMDFNFRHSSGKEQVCMLLGNQEDSIQTTMMFYSALMGKWMSHTFVDLQVTGFAACVHGRDIYVSGGVGTNSRNSDSMHKLERDLSRWTKCGGNMTIALSHHAMVANDSCLYVVGGRKRYGINGAVLQFCLRSERWEEHGEIIAPVEDASAVCLNNKIYIIGGVLNVNEPRQAADSVQMYDIKKKTASILCHLPSPCSFSCATARNDQIFVMTANGEVICLSGKSLAETNLVATVPDFKNRSGFGMGVKGDTMAVYGGKAEGGNNQDQTGQVYVNLVTGKFWNGKALSRACTWSASLNVVVIADSYND